ncbi:MAG: DMT family transporter [Anaerolineae bacterium]|nr:DMT family transporter [Anaerolineae bacterium]
MTTFLFVIIIGLIGGLAVGFQGPLTSLMSQRLGILESLFIIHLGGTVVAGLPLLIAGGGSLGAWRSVPWYALGAGSLGLVILGAISFTIPHLGVATTIALVVIGQLVIGLGLDHFGLLGVAVRPIEVSRLLGVVILIIGTWLVLH